MLTIGHANNISTITKGCFDKATAGCNLAILILQADALCIK
jgi:hypothetical protein